MRCGKAIRDGAGQFATQSLFRDAARHVATKTSRIKIGVNTGKAMRHGSLRRGTPRRYKRRGAYMTMRESPQGMEASIGCAARDGMGGGIFAKTAKTPPLQSALRSASRPKAAHCRRLHARTMPPRTPPSYGDLMVFTTTRHAASLRSSNNCKCLIETFFIARGRKALSIKD